MKNIIQILALALLLPACAPDESRQLAASAEAPPARAVVVTPSRPAAPRTLGENYVARLPIRDGTPVDQATDEIVRCIENLKTAVKTVTVVVQSYEVGPDGAFVERGRITGPTQGLDRAQVRTQVALLLNG